MSQKHECSGIELSAVQLLLIGSLHMSLFVVLFMYNASHKTIIIIIQHRSDIMDAICGYTVIECVLFAI